ncbi:MAG: hypothetical protein HC919_11155 [Oscillatoriales cyanobacterium SM2_2_1]|nr:hypothetical protein [Oscillatoriales cyanobacterium SM2_2_1]
MAGLFLVTHGSRDRASWQFLQDLVAMTRCLAPGIPISGGCLEGQPQPLEVQLQTFCQPLPPNLPVAIAPIFCFQESIPTAIFPTP